MGVRQLTHSSEKRLRTEVLRESKTQLFERRMLVPEARWHQKMADTRVKGDGYELNAINVANTFRGK